MSSKMKELTKAEDQVMQILWQLKKGFVHDIIERIPKPKPAYNTISTIVRILVKKGIVGYKAYGKTHEYFPIIGKAKYSNFYINNFVGKYFNGSFQNMVSFFAQENQLTSKQVEEMMKSVEQDLKTKNA